ncbi:hypothetical protein C1I98_19215 [Spongiactinospora gelatinilytica]|uniref:Uncharacterized protein n=1 Tax=Spongiactinospora gelatinilytica TaxID=2666298 RepID=A0A2W2HWG8_9ACTN|nr:hypothetical protein C1I98_19215 [Spongiactinospora gelatinilytica]
MDRRCFLNENLDHLELPREFLHGGRPARGVHRKDGTAAEHCLKHGLHVPQFVVAVQFAAHRAQVGGGVELGEPGEGRRVEPADSS